MSPRGWEGDPYTRHVRPSCVGMPNWSWYSLDSLTKPVSSLTTTQCGNLSGLLMAGISGPSGPGIGPLIESAELVGIYCQHSQVMTLTAPNASY